MILRFTSEIVLFVAVMVALANYRSVKNNGGWFIVWIFFSLLSETVSLATSLTGINNLGAYYIYTISETWIVLMATNYYWNKKYQKPLLSAAILLSLMTVAEYILNKSHFIGTYSRVAQGLVLTIICIIGLIKSVNGNKFQNFTFSPSFWLYTSCIMLMPLHTVIAAAFNNLLGSVELLPLLAINNIATIAAAGVTVLGIIVVTKYHKAL